MCYLVCSPLQMEHERVYTLYHIVNYFVLRYPPPPHQIALRILHRDVHVWGNKICHTSKTKLKINISIIPFLSYTMSYMYSKNQAVRSFNASKHYYITQHYVGHGK